MSYPNSYIICATPRSGTTLLCDLLTDTGIAGKPDSFFQLQSRQWWAKRLNVPTINWTNEHAFDKTFLEAVIQRGKSETPVFGMRLLYTPGPRAPFSDGVLYICRVFSRFLPFSILRD